MCRPINDMSAGKDSQVFAPGANGFKSVTAAMGGTREFKCRSLRYAAG